MDRTFAAGAQPVRPQNAHQPQMPVIALFDFSDTKSQRGSGPHRDVRPVVPGYAVRYEARASVPGEKSVKPSEVLEQHRETIRSVVEANRATNARVFGSVLHGVDSECSDLDVLIDPTDSTTLFDIGAIRSQLSDLLGIRVDVLTPMALPESFRDAVLSEAKEV